MSGHDGHGSPAGGQNEQCFRDVLSVPEVYKYFVSQHREEWRSTKMEFLPIGFGVYPNVSDNNGQP